MRLSATDGQSLELALIQYQFPEQTDYWDGNWLRVSISVSHAKGTWQTTDPSLLTFEVAELVGWLTALAEDRATDRRLDFTEPNLAFEVLGTPPAARLRAYFAIEYRPPWSSSIGASRDDWVEFPLAELDLRGAAEVLGAQLAAFPVKGKGEIS